ncbi:MAG: 5-(carboxyamino)imidazole ribonucleotide synthase, partial [Vulcanimicrobiaceae bacterium]
IPLDSVRALEDDGRQVRPDASVLRVTQDRILEKRFVRETGCATAPFAPVRDEPQLRAALAEIGFPGVLKTARGGYDGKGQWAVRSEAAALAALEGARGAQLIYEQFIDFDVEVSVISARSAHGDIVVFPVSENQHDHGVLATSIVPARVSALVAERVRAASAAIGERLGIIGAYCIEFFVRGDQIFVNEIAPRVHNSGHYSLDATQISQYEAHVRAICDLPLVEPELLRPAVMVNILGGGKGDVLAGVSELLRDPGVKLHVYGKTHAALRRKMGHFTVLGHSLDDALTRAAAGRAKLGWVRQAEQAAAPVG